MTIKEKNPFVSFYDAHKISPVRQDITDFKRHLLRREKLFRTLGLPHILTRDKLILEIGPGSGYNSLTFFEWGCNVDFVEPNPTAQKELSELFCKYRINEDRWNLFPCKIEDYLTDNKYDIVLAEGFIPGLDNKKEVLEKITFLIKAGGIIIVTCHDDISYFFEVLKRLIAVRLLMVLKVERFSEKIKVLSRAFKSHLESLGHASKLIEDYVADNFFNPAVFTKNFFTMADCIIELGSDFDFLGSSPSMFTDYSWYKDTEFNSHREILNQYYKKRHALILHSLGESIRTIEVNNDLLKKTFEFRTLAGKIEGDLNKENINQIIALLQDIGQLTDQIDGNLTEAINEGCSLLLDENIDEYKISKAEKLKCAFGRGQQYVSMVKKSEDYKSVL